MTETRNRGSPRLRFSKEELENPELAQKAEKAKKAADRYDAAKKKLQKRRLKLTAEEVQTEQDAMQQIEAYRVNIGYPKAVCTYASCARASAGTYCYAVSFSIAYKVGYYQEIVDKAHFLYYRHFVFGTIKNIFRHGFSVAFYKPFSYLSVKVYFVVVIAFRLEKRQDSMSECEADIALFRNFYGIVIG